MNCSYFYYTNNNEKIMSDISLSISQTNITVKDNLTNYRIEYLITSSKVTEIKTGYGINYQRGSSVNIEYFNKKTKITNEFGESSYIYFNSCNFPKVEIDEFGTAVELMYDTSNELLTYKSFSVLSKEKPSNLLSSESVDEFISDGVDVELAICKSFEPFMDILGTSLRKCSGTGVLFFELNKTILPDDVLTLSIWGRRLTELTSSSRVGVILKLITGNEEIKTVRLFDKEQIDNNFDLLTMGLTADKKYEKVVVYIVLEGDSSIELGGIQLLQKNRGTHFEYDEKSNLLEYGINGQNAKMSYNGSNLVSNSLDENSSFNKYQYNSRNLLVSTTSAYQTTLKNEYDNYNNITKSTVYKNNLKIMESSRTYSNGRFVKTTKDEDGNITTYSFNEDYGYLTKVIDVLGFTTSYEYFDDELLNCIKLNDVTKSSYTYENNKLKTIAVSNGTVYQFDYDDYENVIAVKLNDMTIYRFDYDVKNNIIKQYCGNNNNEYYEFVYQDYRYLTQIKYVKNDEIKICHNFTYDDLKRLKTIENVDGSTENYIYDNEGKLLTVSMSGATLKYIYDSNGNIIGVQRNVKNKKIYQEFNNANITKGCNPDALLENVISGNKNIVLFNSNSNSFNNDDIFTIIGSHRKEIDNVPCTLINNSYLLSYRVEGNGSDDLTECSVAFWFKPENSEFYLYSAKSTIGSRFIGAYLNQLGQVVLEIIDDSGMTKTLITTNRTINYNQWNFFALSFAYNQEEDTTKFLININGTSYEYPKKKKDANEQQIHFELPTRTIFNIGHKYDAVTVSRNMIGYIATLMIDGTKSLTKDEVMKYYEITKEYAIENCYLSDDVVCTDFSNTTLFTESTYTQLLSEIVPLQHNFSSLKNTLPIVSEKRLVSSLDKDRSFIFNKVSKNYAYVADGNQLVYNFHLRINEGLILMRAYTDVCEEKQYFFEIKDGTTSLGLFRNESNKLCVAVNEMNFQTNLIFENKKWHTVGISYQDYSTITVYLDSSIYVINNMQLVDPKNLLKLMIGRKFEADNSDVYPLYGQVEMLAISTRFVDYSRVQKIVEELAGYNKSSAYDELGMLRRREVNRNGNPLLVNKYSYKMKDGSTTMKTKTLAAETIEAHGNVIANRNYTTDKLGRVTGISDPVFGNHLYEYDERGYLVREDETVTYNYDENGNIIQKGNVTLVYDDDIKDKLISYGNQAITYYENMPGFISSYAGNSFSYEGNKLVEVSNDEQTLSFKYNHLGQRIRKTVTKNGGDTVTNFYYDGDMLIAEECESTRIDYLYDENKQLYGFIYENNKYFYVRDALQNIIGITSQSGELVVKYNYSAYGELLEIHGPSLIIGAINPFRYKGYYYDDETGLFMVGHRYYNPEWGRWLSPDDIEYLDPQSINGLNLYAYCNNDPVNKYDPTGHFAISTLVWGIVLGAVFGGLGAGAISALEGNNIEVIIGDALGGALIGGATGAAFTLGGLFGAGLLSTKAAAISLVATTASSFAAGVGANHLQSYSRGEEINMKDSLIDGAFTAAQSLVSFYVGGVMSYGGYWDSLNTKAFSNSIRHYKNLGDNFGKSVVKGSVLYLKQYGEHLFGRTVTKFIYSYPWSYWRAKY